jgi:hypothetical protein
MKNPVASIEGELAKFGVETDAQRLYREARQAERREKMRTYPSHRPIPKHAPIGLLDWEGERWWWELLPTAAQNLKREAVEVIRKTTRNIHRRGRRFKGSEWNTTEEQAEAYGVSVWSIKLLMSMPSFMLSWFNSASGEKGIRK